MSTKYAYQWSDGFEFLNVLRRGPMDLKFGHAFQRSNGFKIWTCFPEVRWFDFGRASQRSIEIEFWTCFPEVRWFEV